MIEVETRRGHARAIIERLHPNMKLSDQMRLENAIVLIIGGDVNTPNPRDGHFKGEIDNILSQITPSLYCEDPVDRPKIGRFTQLMAGLCG